MGFVARVPGSRRERTVGHRLLIAGLAATLLVSLLPLGAPTVSAAASYSLTIDIGSVACIDGDWDPFGGDPDFYLVYEVVDSFTTQGYATSVVGGDCSFSAPSAWDRTFSVDINNPTDSVRVRIRMQDSDADTDDLADISPAPGNGATDSTTWRTGAFLEFRYYVYRSADQPDHQWVGTWSGAAFNAEGAVVTFRGDDPPDSSTGGGHKDARISLTLRDSGTFTVDTVPPSSSMAPLPPNQPTPTFTISWSGTDATSGVAWYDVQSRVEGTETWTDFRTKTTLTSATFTGTEGTGYCFRSRAMDNAGNWESYPLGAGDVCTTVAHAGPITLTGSPTDASVAEGGSQAFSVTVTDVGGHDVTAASTITWSVSPSECGTVSPTTGASTTFSASTSAGGTSCTVRAGAGFSTWQASLDVPVQVTHAGPLDVNISPAAPSVVEGGSVSFTATVMDANGHDLTSESTIAWSVSPAACGTVSPTGTTVVFASSSSAGGTACTVSAQATFDALSQTQAVTFTVSHGPVTTIVVSPATANVAPGGTATFTATARDAAGHDLTGTVAIAWTVTPATCGSLSPTSGASTTFTAAAAAAGTSCTITASAAGVQGVAAVSVAANQPPSVTVSQPSDGATVSGTITISGSASDQDGTVQRVEVQIDGGEWQTASGTTSWSFTLDTTRLDDREHTIRVRSYDGVDYSDVATLPIVVSNGIVGGIPLLFLLIAIVIAIAIAGVVVALVARRKRHRPGPPT